MAEIVRIQDCLSGELKRRFERQLALAFSDMVGSTAYFARFGDEAGRRLQQRHFDLISKTIPGGEGRVVDTAGDGAFFVFPSVERALGALIELQKAIAEDNLTRSREDILSVRMGVHWGSVLTDGTHVTGDAVNLASRVTAAAVPGEIRLTRDAHSELTELFYRLNTRDLGEAMLKGIPRPVRLYALEWHDRTVFPEAARILETGEIFTLPQLDMIRFGRLDKLDGVQANDVVLALPDAEETRKISRWHFELRRHPDALVLRCVSDGGTEVDGAALAKGAEARVRAGSRIRVARVLTLELFTAKRIDASQSTLAV
jgi:class 3 adenylate cyclase